MEREVFSQFKTLLLRIPVWNDGQARKAFLGDLFWGHDLLGELDYSAPANRAATELIELLAGLESPDVDGLTPACALLRVIRERYGAGPQRKALLAALESSLCESGTRAWSVLFCAADPEDQEFLRTDSEFKKIKESLDQVRHGEGISLHLPELAIRSDDFSRVLHQSQPDIVHFSGHGGGHGGIYLEDPQGNAKPVATAALASLFRQFKHCVKVVVLNGCHTEPQAEAISAHIDYVIGTREDIDDDAAIAFSVGFYRALAAERSVAEAFQLGCSEIRMLGIPDEHQIPLLMTGAGKVTLCD